MQENHIERREGLHFPTAEALAARNVLLEHMEADTATGIGTTIRSRLASTAWRRPSQPPPSETLADLVATAQLLLEWVHDDKGDTDGEKAETFAARLAA